jgi:hypothetical protein
VAYKLIEIRENSNLEQNNPSYCTFDVLTELDGMMKWLSIPYELYFQRVEENNKNLYNYIKKINFNNDIQRIKDLEELGFNFGESLLEYITKFYSENVFKNLPTYDPDKLFDHNFFEEDDEDEF